MAEDEEVLNMTRQHQIVVAINYGTTLTGMPKELLAVTQHTAISTAS
jgi:hypothetical protein